MFMTMGELVLILEALIRLRQHYETSVEGDDMAFNKAHAIAELCVRIKQRGL